VTASATGVMTSATTADLTVTGTGNVSGQNCDFSVSGVATASSDMTSLSYPYTGTTCFGPVHGTETLNKKSSTPPPPPPDPTPTPTPDPTPPPPPPPGFDLPQSILLNSPRDMASWPITTRISNIDINAGGIAVDFDKKDGAGRWPDVPFGDGGSLQYTLGMCLDISGQWYCSSVIEFWYGLERSGGPPSQYALNWFYDPIRWAPMTYHQPAVGETIGLFVCEGDCRNQPAGLSSPLRERSNVVLVAMPSDAGASYPQRLAIRHR
jgi:hypothetical protein